MSPSLAKAYNSPRWQSHSFPVCLHSGSLPSFHLGPHCPWLSSTPRVSLAYLARDSFCGPFYISSSTKTLASPTKGLSFTHLMNGQARLIYGPSTSNLFLLWPTYLDMGFRRTHQMVIWPLPTLLSWCRANQLSGWKGIPQIRSYIGMVNSDLTMHGEWLRSTYIHPAKHKCTLKLTS